jgi:hypothetical protein
MDKELRLRSIQQQSRVVESSELAAAEMVRKEEAVQRFLVLFEVTVLCQDMTSENRILVRVQR